MALLGTSLDYFRSTSFVNRLFRFPVSNGSAEALHKFKHMYTYNSRPVAHSYTIVQVIIATKIVPSYTIVQVIIATTVVHGYTIVQVIIATTVVPSFTIVQVIIAKRHYYLGGFTSAVTCLTPRHGRGRGESG